MRAQVCTCGAPNSHEAGLVVHGGVPAWVEFVRRFGAAHAAPEPSRPRATSSEPSSGVAFPCQRELVTVLAAVVRHCLEANP